MPFSDRAFRALVRELPEVLECLLDVTLGGALALEQPLTPENVDDPNLDLPPTVEADSVARSGDVVLHTECQAYRDPGFEERLFRYHLLLVLRFPKSRVETVAYWLTRPARSRRKGVIVRNSVTVRVRMVVLPELPAELLLENPRTVCFAPCADAAGMSEEELCAEVARRLKDDRASDRELHMAVVAAAMRRRYHLMIHAMQAANVEPVVIEDLVRIGEDLGIEKGLEQGRAEGRAEGIDAAREMLLETLVARGLAPTDAERARIELETSLERLRAWHRAALRAESMAGVLAE